MWIFFLFSSCLKCTEHQCLACCRLEEALLNTFFVHVLYFKKQWFPPPCCLALFTECNIHERADPQPQRTTPSPHRAAAPWVRHPPSLGLWLKPVPGTPFGECRTSRGITSLWFLVSLLVPSIYNHSESEFRAGLPWTPPGLWGLWDVTEAILCQPHSAASLARVHCTQTAL